MAPTYLVYLPISLTITPMQCDRQGTTEASYKQRAIALQDAIARS
ncbi:hypothetical protein QUA70_20240 [Microcoleus sp. LAD1_D5]